MLPLAVEDVEWILAPLCCIPMVLIVIGILLGLWVYRDAESRGMNGALWLIVVIIGGVVGLIAYLIVREERIGRPTVARICVHCGRAISPEARFCPYCGKELVRA